MPEGATLADEEEEDEGDEEGSLSSPSPKRNNKTPPPLPSSSQPLSFDPLRTADALWPQSNAQRRVGQRVYRALQAILSRDTAANAQGELQGVLASLNAIAMITSPLVMTATFAAFTAPGASIYAPGAPFLLAALLMVAAITLHVAGTRATRPATL